MERHGVHCTVGVSIYWPAQRPYISVLAVFVLIFHLSSIVIEDRDWEEQGQL